METKQQMLQRLKETEEQLKQLKESIAQMPEDKWEPQGGDWVVVGGLIHNCGSEDPRVTTFGCTYDTLDKAAKAKDMMRLHNRMIAYKMEFCPDWEPDWGDNITPKYYIFFNHYTECYEHSSYAGLNTLGTVFLPEQIAEELCKKLNSGEVVIKLDM